MSNRKSSPLILSATAVAFGLWSGGLFAQTTSQENSAASNAGNYFLERSNTRKYALIMTGPSVADATAAQFRQWSFSLHDILIRDYGYSSDTITLLLDRGADEERESSRIDGSCDLEGIRSHLALLKQSVTDGDQLIIFLIGHGSGRNEESKFNIVGPDISGMEFATMLNEFTEQDIVIVNTTSASYGFSTFLSSEGRVVMSATRSPAERYDPIFARYFVEALDGHNGDRDKNNRVSMLEAFNYAKQSVAKWYEDQGRLASENASLDDNGDALFTVNPTAAEADGRLAEIAYMDILRSSDENLSAAALALRTRMRELERDVFILRGRKDDFQLQEYWWQMEVLLVDLARTTGQYNEIP